LVRICDVVNRGAYEYNTRFYLDILNKAMSGTVPTDVALVIMMIGTTDSYDPAQMPKLAIPIDEFRSNLRKLIRSMEAMLIPRNRLMLVTGPPSYLFSQTVRDKDRAMEYGEATIEVAKEFKVSWLDLRFKLEYDWKTPEEWNTLFDTKTGVFNLKGSNYFFKILWPVMQIKLKDYMGSAFLTKKFPLWSPSPSG
jgi:hypothetical protein